MTVKQQDRCYCGLPLHYDDKELQRDVEGLVAKLGPNVRHEYDGHTYLIPRHYVALHGIKGKDPKGLGFKPVPMIDDIMKAK